jgi:pre-mRNA-splicing factor ATP-dependent RNA helicase DHX38/PRP16
MDEKVVGYKIRFEDKSTSHPKLKFVTNGMAISELMGLEEASNYDVLIIDEVHERSIDIDILLGLTKGMLMASNDKRLVIMSATMDTSKICKYLGGAPLIKV